MNFLRSRSVALLTIILLLQGGLFYAIASRGELTPIVMPLNLLPSQLGDWQMAQEFPMEPEVQAVLRADDTLSRAYVNSKTGAGASLFIAFFKTQRYGQAPHSPKNCLPGAGFEPVANQSGMIQIDVSGWSQPIIANHYVVERGDDRMMTIYWYQSHNRVIASEYWAKFWLVADAIRYRRSDTALVRITVPVVEGDSESATRIGVAFVQAVFPDLLKQLPN